jgi:hypothetical protein
MWESRRQVGVIDIDPEPVIFNTSDTGEEAV